jgi:hypothetical protein
MHLPLRASLDRGNVARRAMRGGRSDYTCLIVRGELLARAFAALDAGDTAPFALLLDPQARWIGVAGSWAETPT